MRGVYGIPQKKSLHDLREPAHKIVETAEKTPEEQPIKKTVSDDRCRYLKKNHLEIWCRFTNQTKFYLLETSTFKIALTRNFCKIRFPFLCQINILSSNIYDVILNSYNPEQLLDSQSFHGHA